MAIYYGIKVHAFCDMVPEPTEAEYQQILADMRLNGFDPLLPIVMDGEWVVEGRTRMRAAKELGIKPVVKKWEPIDKNDTLAKFVSRCLKRRNLAQSQIAAITVKLLHAEEVADDKEEKKHAKKESKVMLPPDLAGSSGPRLDPKRNGYREIAKRAGTTARAVKIARRAAKTNPAVLARMCSGEMSVKEADEATRLPAPPMKTIKLSASIEEAIDSAPRFDDLAKRASSLRIDMEKLAAEPFGHELRVQRLSLWLKDFASEVKSAKPHAACPCGANKDVGCKACDGLGWLTEAQLKLIPKER